MHTLTAHIPIIDTVVKSILKDIISAKGAKKSYKQI